MSPRFFPWKDYSGRISPLKLVVFVALFCPALWTLLCFFMGWLGARPFSEAIHQVGLWTIRLIFLALLVTPTRQILQWSRLLVVRRMIGVAAFAYALGHFSLYVADQAFDLVKVASEIALRIYLTIGFAALIGLAALAATSTDGMIKRMGSRNWMRLHRYIYLIAVLAVIHYCMQSKLDLWEPMIMAGLLVWLLGYRLLHRRFAVRQRLPLAWVAALGTVAVLVTAGGEATYFALAYHAPVMRVLSANWSFLLGVRPAVVVLGFAGVVTAAGAARAMPPLWAKRRTGFA
ncbi:MAG: sulfoxide reductase heme-binding subunit YedZ [Alphaproteobacteria bacterium]|nr:sulfoxide reductase heme-binding subunit YedZ [Alphaproteobacteria bacterium]